jgi:hypothetical protein
MDVSLPNTFSCLRSSIRVSGGRGKVAKILAQNNPAGFKGKREMYCFGLLLDYEKRIKRNAPSFMK